MYVYLLYFILNIKYRNMYKILYKIYIYQHKEIYKPLSFFFHIKFRYLRSIDYHIYLFL